MSSALSLPPNPYVLFKPDRQQGAQFDQLPATIMPIAPIECSISVKNCYGDERDQYVQASTFTDYNIQGSTLSTAILDLIR